MHYRSILAFLVIACSADPAHSAEYLTTVTSEVFQTNGTTRDIAARANTCISQHLSAGAVDAQVIINSDLERGVIVARSVLEYDNFMKWRVRSVFTFEARDGRFRIEQTNLERFGPPWGPIGKWRGSQWEKANEAFAYAASTVARCVMTVPSAPTW